MKRKQKPQWVRDIAEERINTLLDLAEKNKATRPERSRRYVQLAFVISTRYNTRIPKEKKQKFCKNCFTYWTSKTLKIRAKNKAQHRICCVCGKTQVKVMK